MLRMPGVMFAQAARRASSALLASMRAVSRSGQVVCTWIIAGLMGLCRASLKRFAKNLNHRFSRNAVLRSIVARVPPLADISGKGRNALVTVGHRRYVD